MPSTIIYASKDSYVDSGNPTTNHGADSTIYISNTSAARRNTILEFDTSSLPADITITSATLYTYISSIVDNTSDEDIEVYRNTAQFTESTVTWNSAPSYYATPYLTDGTFKSIGWHSSSAGITSLVQDALNLNNNYIGITLYYAYENPLTVYNVGLDTKESGTSNEAYLVINYEYNHFYVRASGGSDSNGGSSWSDAWATVNKGMTDTPTGKTLHIGFGTYASEPSDNKVFPDNAITVIYETATTGGGSGTASVEINS